MDHEENGSCEQPVQFPIEDSIDLHTFSPKDIPDVLCNYLEECHAAGLREVRIIHGKGIGVQRDIVRKALSRNSLVATFSQAPPEAGGWGATIVILRENKAPKDSPS